jgi:hypothetical protein
VSVPAVPVRARSNRGAALGVLIDLVLPLAAYYGLRAAGASIYVALLAGALAAVLGVVVSLVRVKRITGTTAYALTTMLLGTGVALLTGSPRFLLAREGWVTAFTGLWFLASIATRRPLAYLISRPLLEGRLRWPAGWDELWRRSPRFRRVWRISSLLWGLGTLADSAARVVMAYTLPVDLVPTLSSVLYLATSVVIIAVTNILYAAAGVFTPSSAMYRQV